MALSDAELVTAARAGDAGAFAALAERHYPLLLRSCRRALGDSVSAHDAAQEAVLTAMLGLARLRREDRFAPWLIGIGLNACRRLRRAERRRPAESLERLAPSSEPAAPGLSPVEAAEAAHTAARVRGAIAALAPGQRAAVALFYLGGLTHAETAEELGTAVSAVKTRLHKARNVLDDRLQDLREEPPMLSTDPLPARVVDLRRTAGEHVRHIVFLEAADGRRLPIWIGPAEATALACLLEDVELPRPGPHQLTASLIAAAGARVTEVRISALTEAVFYARVLLEGGAEVDARPSDALALALVMGVPISVDPAVLAQAEHDEGTLGAELAEALEAADDAGALAEEALARIAETAAETAELASRSKA